MKIIKPIIVSICLLAIEATFAQEVEGGMVGETWIAGKKKAEEYYNNLKYYDAIVLYEKLLKKKEDTKAQAQLADCYRLTGEYQKAADAYKKATIGNAAPETYLHLAEMLQVTNDRDGAIAAYQKYLQTNPGDERAKNQLEALKNPAAYNKADRYEISNLEFNTPYYDFAPTYFKDGIFFASDRDQSQPINREHAWLGSSFFDMYYAKGEKLSFSKPGNIKKEGESRYHDAAATFTPDEKTVFFTRNNYINKKTQAGEDKIVKQGIYEAIIDGQKWKDIKAFKYNNPAYDVAHPALSPDGNTLYFASNKPAGKGGMDLYVAQKNGQDWSEPMNLTALNTTGDELFPSVDKDGNLYFASNGWGGLGGLDIFRSAKATDAAVNVGAPLNSTYDDFGVSFGKEPGIGYFTSNRPTGKGKDDIWSFTDKGIFLEGIVVDAITQEPIDKSEVEMFLSGISKGKNTTKEDGIFRYDVVPGKTYNFNASAKEYADNKEVAADTKNAEPGSTVKVTIPLQPKKPVGYAIQVIDKATKKEVNQATVDITSQTDENRYQQQVTGTDGKTCYTVICGNEYLATAGAKGYLSASQPFSTKNNCDKLADCSKEGGKTLIIELERDPNAPADNDTTSGNGNELSKQLKDIYFDFDKWTLRTESKPQLQKVLTFLNENPTAIVELGAYTDARATDEYNIELSQKRAQSVVDWLVKNGIDKKRIKPVGYGETRPRNNCSDEVKCTEYEHQRNRRVEFRIIGGSVDIKSFERLDMKVDPCTVCPF